MSTTINDNAGSALEIDPDVFFRDFLGADPKYSAVISVLERLRASLAAIIDRDSLTLSELIDITSVEYDDAGDIVAKSDDLLKSLARAMKGIEISREALRSAAGSGLTEEQIAEGPTSIKLPLGLLTNRTSFANFISSLRGEYRECGDLCSLVRTVNGLRLHQKPMFLLIGEDARILAYYSPAWSMQEMFNRIILGNDQVLADLYNSKLPLTTFCSLATETEQGHVKVVYLGRRNS